MSEPLDSSSNETIARRWVSESQPSMAEWSDDATVSMSPTPGPDEYDASEHEASGCGPKRFREQSWESKRRSRQCLIADPFAPGKDHKQLTSTWPDGPATLEEFADWPGGQVRRLLGGPGGSDEAASLRRRRLEALLCSGSVVHSDYSGMQGPEVMMRMQHKALSEVGVELPPLGGRASAGGRFLTSWRACDRDPLCTQLAVEGAHKPVHFFKDIVGRLPDSHRETLVRYDPVIPKRKHNIDMSLSAEAYRRMDEHLAWHADEVFNWSRRSATCVLHPGKRCLISSKFHLGSEDEQPGVAPPIAELVAGPMCTPWSSFGTELGLGDPATKPWVCFVNEAANLKYDLTWVENSPFFPVELLQQKWETTHKILWVVAGPEHLGWPIFRRRLFAVGISRETLVWAGPSTPGGVQEAFSEFFRARCVVTGGDVFLGSDTEEQRQAVVRAMSQARGVWTKRGDKVDYRKLLPQKAQDDKLCKRGRSSLPELVLPRPESRSLGRNYTNLQTLEQVSRRPSLGLHNSRRRVV